jgi:hypothetical protein
MSTDQWNPDERVRVHLVFRDGGKGHSGTMSRREAEVWLSSATWLSAPISKGRPVQSAAIRRVFE